MRDSVTSGDPTTSSLKTSFQEKIAVQTATGSSPLRPQVSNIQATAPTI